MAGRVLALFSVAFIGSATIGSPAVGLIAELLHSRAGLGVSGVVGIVAGVITVVGSYRRAHTRLTGSTGPRPPINDQGAHHAPDRPRPRRWLVWRTLRQAGFRIASRGPAEEVGTLNEVTRPRSRPEP